MKIPHWVQDAACAGEDPALFFPERGQSTATAKAICAPCPVRELCLDWAMEAEAGAGWSHRYGIFGGKSVLERAALAGRARGNAPAARLGKVHWRDPHFPNHEWAACGLFRGGFEITDDVAEVTCRSCAARIKAGAGR